MSNARIPSTISAALTRKFAKGAAARGWDRLFFVVVARGRGTYLFLDSVMVTTLPMGWLSGGFNRIAMGGNAPTTIDRASCLCLCFLV